MQQLLQQSQLTLDWLGCHISEVIAEYRFGCIYSYRLLSVFAEYVKEGCSLEGYKELSLAVAEYRATRTLH